MRILKASCAVALGVVSTLVAAPAFAQGDPQQPPAPAGPSLTVDSSGNSAVGDGTAPTAAPKKDQVKKEDEKKESAEPEKLIWRGTTISFDQSVSTETVGIGKDYQSRNPYAQLWVSFRPRLWLYEDEKQSLNVNARFDLYKELTNADDTTQKRQDIWGDSWFTLAYSRKLIKENGYVTSVSVAPRILLPTSMTSRENTVVVTAGIGAGVTQIVPILKEGDWLKSARFAGTLSYSHPFVTDTTPGDASVFENRPRLGADGRTGQNNQLSGGFLTKHQLLYVLDTGLNITSKLSATVDFIWISAWKYHTDRDSCFQQNVQNGTTCVGSSTQNQNPTNYTLASWFLASVDYQLFDELGLSLGYYNLAGQIGPDGERRNVFYSQDNGKFFLTATVGLDEFYERLSGRKEVVVQSGPTRSVTKAVGAPFATF